MTDAEKDNMMTRQSCTKHVGESKEVAVNTILAILNNIDGKYKKLDDGHYSRWILSSYPRSQSCIFNYLGRNNIASTKLAGTMEDSDLNDTEFQSCVSTLFMGYNPSNMMLGRLKLPGVYTCLAMTVWGIISTAKTVVSSSAGLAMACFFISFVKAVFFPGLLFYLTIFWCRG